MLAKPIDFETLKPHRSPSIKPPHNTLKHPITDNVDNQLECHLGGTCMATNPFKNGKLPYTPNERA